MKKITVVMWHTYANTMKKIRNHFKDILDIKVYSARFLDEGKEDVKKATKDMEDSDLILLYKSTSEMVWEELEQSIKSMDVPIICDARDPILWTLSTVDLEIVSKCHDYIVYGGLDNFIRMINYIAFKVIKLDTKYEEPLMLPWEGIYHPKADKYFKTVEEYFKWYKKREAPTIGMLISRGNWVNNNLSAENKLILLLERKGYNVMPVFCYSLRDDKLGTRDAGEIIKDYFFDSHGKACINGLIKMVSFFLTTRANNEEFIKKQVALKGVDLLKKLGVPVFQPVTSFYSTIEEWKENPQGLNRDISWTVAMPEFEGVIEPIIVSAAKREGDIEVKMAIDERCNHLVNRIDKWIRLGQKPLKDRKVAFILHNNPCASVEASVGGGANLDTLESVVRIMHKMKDAGYRVEPPKDGKELIQTIMSRKAISEFRWTTADEIVDKKGVLKLLKVEEYCKWFNDFTSKVRKEVIDAWGKPPGEEKNGIPAAMVYKGQIMITGVSYGNAVVCAQPKRGCAGARCDGQVCKILHDPDVPPTHQYIATYRYLENGFGADVLVHVGTHGNLEFLPGKGVGMSNECYSDICLGNIPHLYIYNADNPPEGTVAKRRSYAVLVDHMQTVMTGGGLYDELAQLDIYLEEYEKAKIADPMRSHTLEHFVIEEIKKSNLDKQININDYKDFKDIVEKAHGLISIVRNTQIQDGQHIFGQLPEGCKKVQFINSILKFNNGKDPSLPKAIAKLMDLELEEIKLNQDKFCAKYKKSFGSILEEILESSNAFIKRLLTGTKINEDFAKEILKEKYVIKDGIEEINNLMPRILDLNKRILESKEIEALLSGFDAKYIKAGPSGAIARGRDDVLPTGRNFYSIDPYKVPTKASLKVGISLSEKVIKKHLDEEGRYPETIGIHWMSSDIMWADGEGLAQMLYLLGVIPTWSPNGRVSGFNILKLEELGRPRIDITVRVSGIVRDNFPNCIDLLDEAVQAVAVLDEPSDKNFIRKHTLEKLKGHYDKESLRNATFRIFAAKPGTYQAGVNLAVYASAWKEEKDLADIFIYWNGYAYGKGVFGKESFKELKSSLKTVDITYNKVVSDEYDLLGCCCYFGTLGGMTAAAKIESDKDIKTYYGDTRDPEYVDVRTLGDEIRRVVRTKLLNPKWIEGQKRHGYKGASDISNRIGKVYGWEATTNEVDDWIFDDIVKNFISDEENRKFFEENNPWALEEIGRRLLEANSRGLWKANEKMMEDLKEYYIEIEGWIEDKMGDVKSGFQGGSVDIFTPEEVQDWGLKMKEIKEKLKE